MTSCLGLATPASAQVEPWAAKALSTRDGLSLWLAADGIHAARMAGGESALAADAPLDRWPDASGAKRDFVQVETERQPKLKQLDHAWFVRFDGEDDYLRHVGGETSIDAATFFFVAAIHQNPGEFRGLFAANAPQQRDYVSGLTLDLGPGPTARFDQLNIEGRGFGGANDLLNDAQPFGQLHVLEAIVDPQQREVRLVRDGQPQGLRPFNPGPLSFQELTVGARYYTNGPGEQQVRGPVAADIAEVLVYNRVLSADEATTVRKYLTAKYAKLAKTLPQYVPTVAPAGVPLVKADNPPAVQMLIPGFTVRDLPVELTNVNNVRYRDDGALVTLGYNGDIHLLRDTDGDGLEDQASLFWKNDGALRGPIGIVLTPPGYVHGRGLFVASKGKVSLIVDRDGDDRADEERVVASGWEEIPQNVDAVGLAMDAEGNLFFGLGTANYANAYLVDDAGKAAYDLASDRGTVQKVSADFSRRETVCTGIRFPIAFAFNRERDLFCSEQEGATWLPNGNPFDELLHIRPGRHYGFPPRHPRHNPNVIDEPSTYDFGPQHQSTCGMVFNRSVDDGPVFGPEWWEWDALTCGESRGKLWRTQLVKSAAGYVASSQLIACLQLLTVDACVAPNGDLVVACHSGPPDWGTGPTGIGKLFRIHMSDAAAPRPVATWAESPQEVRITFDRPLDPLLLKQLGEQIKIQYGRHVRAGDRFETLVPPYAVVQKQLLEPRFELPVLGASITNDLRTLLISTARMQADEVYAVTLPSPTTAEAADGALVQHPQVDVEFTLRGVQAEWHAADLAASVAHWSGWLPHLDLQVSRGLLAASEQHRPLWEALQRPGTLTLKTQVDVSDILRPAIQPGATIDYEWPAEQPVLSIPMVQGLKVTSAPDVATAEEEREGQQLMVLTPPDSTRLIPLSLTLRTGGSEFRGLTCSVSTNEDPRYRPLPLRRFLLPWVDPNAQSTSPDSAPVAIAELEGGSWSRGRKLFRSDRVGCFKCHNLHGEGGRIGPDLANLVHRDFHSVQRDILQPSFAINPDYIGHVVALNDGRVLTGVLRTENDQLLLGNDKGELTRLTEADIDTMQPARTSVMPDKLLEKLTPDETRDLMTYLLTPPPRMPLDSPLKAPPLRTPAEVAAALAGSTPTSAPSRPLRMVLVAGDKDHGPGEHDYPAWQRAWQELLSADPTLTVESAWNAPSPEQWTTADVVIFFQKGRFETGRQAQLDAFLARGGGAVYLHWAVNADDREAEFAQRIGLASGVSGIGFRHGPLTLEMHNTEHPILRNFDRLELYDESYWKLVGQPQDVTLLATSVEEGRATPQMWVRDHDPGRVFVAIPGHYNWTFDDPLFRILLLRGIAWTAREPVDRFNELVPLGARMTR